MDNLEEQDPSLMSFVLTEKEDEGPSQDAISKSYFYIYGAISPDCQTLATLSAIVVIQLWRNRRCIAKFDDHKDAITCFSWSPDSRYLVSSSSDGTARIWCEDRCHHMLKESHLPIWGNEFRSVSWREDGRIIATAHQDKTIKLWRDGVHVGELTGHNETVRCVSWSPDAKILASGSDDRTIRLWRDGVCIKVIITSAPIKSISWSPNGKYFAYFCLDGVLYIWDCDKDGITSIPIRINSLTLAFSWSPDGSTLVFGTGKSFLAFWRNGIIIQVHKITQSMPMSLIWTPDGQSIIIISIKKISYLRVTDKLAPDKLVALDRATKEALPVELFSLIHKFI